MPRRVFFSFHYKPDNWRAAQVRNAGVVEGNSPVSDNDWQSITSGGDTAVRRWIDGQLAGRSCAVVLIGSATAGRRWINYEIQKAWHDGKGVLGVYIHRLLDRNGTQAARGGNPFAHVRVNSGPVSLSNVVKVYDPPYTLSTLAHAYIRDNLGSWVDEAVRIRAAW